MSLTVGTGPFGQRPAGSFNFEPPDSVVFAEPFAHRVRAVRGEELLADTRRAQLLYESGRLPVIYLPEEDVVLDRVANDAVTRHERLPGHVSIAWSFPDAWFDEDDEMHGHVRDPYHRIDIRASSRRVVVRVEGEHVAETRRPLILFETGLPPRYYIDPQDVRLELLEPHGLRTRCAYKGIASHWSVRLGGGERAEAVAWSYPEPDEDAARVRGRIAFYNERVDLEVDGEPDTRPQTQWSAARWWST